MKNYNEWVYESDGKDIESIIKYNIACAAYGGINCSDLYGVEMLTVDEWIKYIYEVMQEQLEVDGGTVMGKDASKHLRFFGKERTHKLISEYVQNESEVKQFVKK